MRRILALLPALLVAGLLPGAAQGSCHQNIPPCISGVPAQDRQLILLGSMFVPDDLTVNQPGTVFIQNFDQVAHTVTHVGCDDGNAATMCWFHKEIPAFYNLMRAQKLNTGPPPGSASYVPPGTYKYYCRNHGDLDVNGEPTGMRGVLRVV